MNLPSLRSMTSLYHLDEPFARLTQFTGIILVASVTVGWFSIQMNAAITDPSAGIETSALSWTAVAGLALVVLGLLLLLRRHQWMHHVVSHGDTIKGVVKKIEIRTSRLPAEKHAPWSPRLSHTHFAVVAYDCAGVTRQARLKLPAGSSITEGAEVDLLVVPRHPARPLLRNVVQNWAHTCSQRR